MSTLGHRLTAVITGAALTLGLVVAGASPSAALPSHGPYPAKVDIDGRGSMDPNDRVTTDAYRTGDSVYVTCQDTGLSAGGSTLWIYTREGHWVPDAYVTTGTSGFLTGVPRCLSVGINGTPSSGGSNSGPYPVKFAIDGRGSADPNDRVRVDAYPDGSSLYVRCQDYGVSAGGSTLWIYSTDGYWVPDAYVTTGTSGRIPGVALCSSIGIDGGSGAVPGGGRQFKIRTTLNGYHAKSLSASNVWDKYPEGSYITVMCQAYGETNYGGSAIWNRTSDGLWVPDYYVITGSSGMVLNSCDGDSPSGNGTRFLAKTTLNGYHGKSLNATYVLDKYAAGSYVEVQCQAYGEFNYGGHAVWSYTSDGLWVADYYLSTGSWDIILRRCDNDPKPGGGTGNPTVPPTPVPGSVAGSDIRSKIVNAANEQVGTHEWGDNCNPYGRDGVKCGDPWCSMFASWAWRQAGVDVYFPYSGSFETWGRNRGLLRSKNDIRPGDVVLYGTNYYNSHHVGIVVEVLPDGRIITIEGNYNNKVRKMGPFNPNDPAAGSTGHSYRNIYAVVAPVADPVTSATWSTQSLSDQDSEKDGIDHGEELCTDQYAAPGMLYKACLAFNASSSRAKPRLHVWPIGNTKVVRGKLTMIDANGDLHTVMCEAALITDDRTCEGTGYHPTSGRVARLRTDIETDGGWRRTLRIGTRYADGEEQLGSTWCGVAATQAILKSLGKSPLPTQAQVAAALDTSDRFGSWPWDVRDYLNQQLSGPDYVYHDYAAEGSTSDKWEFVKNKMRHSLDLGRPAAIVTQIKDIPWWNSSDAWPLEMHYLVVTGYAGEEINGNYHSVDRFLLWDPAKDEHFIATSGQLYSMTNSDGIPGQGHMIVVAE